MTTPELILPTVGDAAREVIDAGDRTGPGWQLRFGSVFQVQSSTSAQVQLDGDTATTIPVISLVGTLVRGSRVAVIHVPPSGNYVVAASPPFPRLVAYGSRSTSSTANAAAQGVLRLDNVPIKANRLYVAETSNILIFSSVAGDTGSARFSYVFGGGTAGTGSTLLTLWNSSAIATTGGGTGAKLSAFLPIQASDTMLSLLLFTLRITGTGNISLFAAANTILTEMKIYDWGPDVGNTGVAL